MGNEVIICYFYLIFGISNGIGMNFFVYIFLEVNELFLFYKLSPPAPNPTYILII